MEAVNPFLVEHMDLIAPGGKSQRILVPLCGDTHDLLYLLRLSHSVFGIEGVKESILRLEARDRLGLVFSADDSVYRTPDSKLQIFCGNIIDCPIEKWGPFDAVWDRASMGSIEYSLRPGYLETMKRALKDSDGNCKKSLNFYCHCPIFHLLNTLRAL
jgi:thiopurine S-methyltransferase